MAKMPIMGKPPTGSNNTGLKSPAGKPNNLTSTVPYVAPKGAFRDMKH